MPTEYAIEMKGITKTFGSVVANRDVELNVRQGEILALLDAPRKIGLCATANHILTPRKSVTAILGVAKGWIEREPKESCARCFLKGRCSYQLRGKTCGA